MRAGGEGEGKKFYIVKWSEAGPGPENNQKELLGSKMKC